VAGTRGTEQMLCSSKMAVYMKSCTKLEVHVVIKYMANKIAV
jgi:hypothetical protein